MEGTPRVTVLMPVYNGEKYLRPAIDSILDQSFENFELLVINDGSTDNSMGILKGYTDPRIRLIHNEQNLKLIKTLNKGIELAKGEYIARMDCDDISAIYRLEMQVDFLDRNPQVGLLGSNAIIISKAGKKLYCANYPSSHFTITWALCFYCPIVHPSVMIRKDIIQRYGGYDESKLHTEDYHLWCKMSREIRFGNLPVPLLYLRKHDLNISNENYVQHIINASLVNQEHLFSLTGEQIDIGTIKCLRYRTCQSLETRVMASRLIQLILKQFKQGQNIPDGDLHLVNNDASLRMFALVAPYIYHPRTWKILADALIADPLVIIRAIKLLTLRMFRKTK